MNLAMWLAYGVFLVGFAWYFRRGAMHPYAHGLVDALILSNGVSSMLTAVWFIWLLPEFAHLSPVYPGPETLVSIVISVGDGIRVAQRSEAQRPVVLQASTAATSGLTAEATVAAAVEGPVVEEPRIDPKYG